MTGYVRTFLNPQGLFYSSIIIFWICYLGMNGLYFSSRYSHWSHEHEKLKVYCTQDLCKNLDIRSKTDGRNKCDEYALLLRTEPWANALYDVFSANYICSGGGCVQWFSHILSFLALFSLGIFYITVRHTAWAFSKVEEIRHSLPIIFNPNPTHLKKA